MEPLRVSCCYLRNHTASVARAVRIDRSPSLRFRTARPRALSDAVHGAHSSEEFRTFSRSTRLPAAADSPAKLGRWHRHASLSGPAHLRRARGFISLAPPPHSYPGGWAPTITTIIASAGFAAGRGARTRFPLLAASLVPRANAARPNHGAQSAYKRLSRCAGSEVHVSPAPVRLGPLPNHRAVRGKRRAAPRS